MSITEPHGVSSVMLETKIIAKEALKHKKKRILDMGTGTGYIAIYLTKEGCRCDGADISKKSIETAKLNSKRNGVKVHFFESDLFQNVKDKYDLIIFNPPLGDFGGNVVIDTLKSTVRSIPLIYKSVRGLASKIFDKQKMTLNRRFINGARSHLNASGCLLMLVSPYEVKKIEGYAKEYGFQPDRVYIKELLDKRNLLLLLLKLAP